MSNKDYKAHRLYLKLAKAQTPEQQAKAQQKISEYFFAKRREADKTPTPPTNPPFFPPSKDASTQHIPQDK